MNANTSGLATPRRTSPPRRPANPTHPVRTLLPPNRRIGRRPSCSTRTKQKITASVPFLRRSLDVAARRGDARIEGILVITSDERFVGRLRREAAVLGTGIRGEEALGRAIDGPTGPDIVPEQVTDENAGS